MEPKICVIGAGVIGLSTAVNIQKRIPTARVTIIAEEFSPNLTSDVAAGIWEPHILGNTDVSLQRKWATETFEHYAEMLMGELAGECGIQLISGYQLFNEDMDVKVPFWSDIVFNFRILTADDNAKKFLPPHSSGWSYSTILAHPPHYMKWLIKRFHQEGGSMIKMSVKNFEQVAFPFDVIVNCTGLGARKLANDSSVEPVQGHVLKVIAPWVKNFLMSTSATVDTYIVPGVEIVTLGGTGVKGAWNTTPDAEVSQRIWRNCCNVLPSLKDAKVVREAVGLRPFRPTVRLEMETLKSAAGDIKVVHNYGHGGSGFTVQWGVAREAAELVVKALEHRSHLTSKL
ncbi:PREDICTED: D-aspartate oxidase-like isoform X2 [Priapulus caudatus]|uniref:D-aspartate oxidase-like isoform X2 n=1 Tax=Priapulus caudatus TaxID=37621 RepID=A0ABM1DRM1_PRICU|nr:PREDICTED: D-aspartate oxidase-like isoform X2 [Priapulus caudatus]